MTKSPSNHRLKAILGILIVILLAPLWVPLLLLLVAVLLLWYIALHLAVWMFWLPRSRRLLLVYSDSPLWQSHVESRILPLVRDQAVVLNWSRRRTWRRSLAVAVFKFFGGAHEFNPMVIVFRPLRGAKVFRFHRPFHDLKHGKPEALASMEEKLFRYLRLPGTRTRRQSGNGNV